MVWNVILTCFIAERPARQKDTNGNTTENVVVDYSTDISEMAENVRSSIVTVNSQVSGFRRTASGIVYARDEEYVYIFTTEQSDFDEGGLTVTFDSSASVTAELVASDSECGVSLLKIKPPFEVTLMRSGSSSVIRQGEYAAVMGGRSVISGSSPMSFGIISRPAQRRIASGGTWFASTIDVDAIVTADMLGGPLLNVGGQMIGMLIGKTGSDRMAYAVGVNEMKLLFDEFITAGKVERGALCLSYRSIGSMRPYEKSERSIKLDVTSGVLVTSVPENSSCAGLIQEGDLLLKIDGQEISDEEALKEMLYDHMSGDAVIVTVQRAGETSEVSVSLQ